MRHYKLQMLCQTQREPWQRDEHTHTERSLPKVIQTLPYVPSESQKGYSLANEAKTDTTAEQTCSFTHAASTTCFNAVFSILASQSLQDSQQDKTVDRWNVTHEMCRPPPKKLVKKSRKSNKRIWTEKHSRAAQHVENICAQTTLATAQHSLTSSSAWQTLLSMATTSTWFKSFWREIQM